MSLVMYDFLCSRCGLLFESLEPRGAEFAWCCGYPSADRVLSPVYGRVQKVSAVTRGGVEEAPPGAVDTRPIARRAGVDC